MVLSHFSHGKTLRTPECYDINSSFEFVRKLDEAIARRLATFPSFAVAVSISCPKVKRGKLRSDIHLGGDEK